MKEVIQHYMPKIEKSNILNELKLAAKKYFVVSVHREENVDNPENLEKILTVLDELQRQYKYPIIVSTHPRARKRIEEKNNKPENNQIRLMKPFGFTDYIRMQQDAACTISDSGTISEESAILSFPAISIRQSMERPEAQDAGTIILTGFNKETVLKSVELVMKEHSDGKYSTIPQDYQVDNTSWRVLKLIMGNAGLSNLWHGVRA
jgi:UDP-N-acetylglucosamine 2-epimerase (non-hydrolysing)